MSDKVFVGRNMAQLDTSPPLEAVSKVVLMVDADNAYVAGTDTGRTIEVTCPYGTQAMANNILAALQRYTYTPAQAQDALLDPAAEMGDGLTLGGIYTVLAQADTQWDALMASDAGAPGQAEQESEYSYQSPLVGELRYQIAETRSLISKTNDEIRLEVENEINELSSSFSVQLQQIQSQVTGLNGQVSTITQKVDNITLSVDNGSTSSSISLSVGGVEVSSQTIQMNGLVTFTGLANGTTTIDGDCIKTGTIDAARLNLTGAITWTDLDSDVEDRINDAYNTAIDNQLPDYIKSTYIDSTRIESPEIYGGEIYALNGSGAYAKMDDDAFSLMYEGSSIPRAVLQVSNSDATLVLGVGTGTDQDAGRFFITKSAIGGGAASVFYITNNGDPIGITFQNNGTIGFSADRITGLYMVFD